MKRRWTGGIGDFMVVLGGQNLVHHNLWFFGPFMSDHRRCSELTRAEGF
jgi:hypothetical protein